jgi:D-sedoheptulose 7-phosphate isomerase
VKAALAASLEAHGQVWRRVVDELQPALLAAAERVSAQLLAGHKIFLCGNGGSAADAQHFAAELTGRFVCERRALPALALTTDTSALTAIGNDYGYERVFERQLEAFARPGDVLIALSTSGRSENVLRAARRARALGCQVIGLTGGDGGALLPLCDVALCVPSRDSARIQEMHGLFGHVICQLAESAVVAADADTR